MTGVVMTTTITITVTGIGADHAERSPAGDGTASTTIVMDMMMDTAEPLATPNVTDTRKTGAAVVDRRTRKFHTTIKPGHRRVVATDRPIRSPLGHMWTPGQQQVQQEELHLIHRAIHPNRQLFPRLDLRKHRLHEMAVSTTATSPMLTSMGNLILLLHNSNPSRHRPGLIPPCVRTRQTGSRLQYLHHHKAISRIR